MPELSKLCTGRDVVASTRPPRLRTSAASPRGFHQRLGPHDSVEPGCGSSTTFTPEVTVQLCFDRRMVPDSCTGSQDGGRTGCEASSNWPLVPQEGFPAGPHRKRRDIPLGSLWCRVRIGTTAVRETPRGRIGPAGSALASRTVLNSHLQDWRAGPGRLLLTLLATDNNSSACLTGSRAR